MRSSNPALSSKTFTGLRESSEKMTIQGTVNKTGILLLLCLATATWIWKQYFETGWGTSEGEMTPWLLLGSLGGFIVALVTIFKKTWAPFTSPIYALLEGLAIGCVSVLAEMRFPGIVIQATGLTFGTLFILLFGYKTGIIRVTDTFRAVVVAATGGIFIVYLVSLILGFFGIPISLIHSSGTAGIIFSLFVVVIAALNLVMDFDFIEHGAAQGAPKYMEWYGAFGLMVTLIWLYLEILRLLAKTRSRK